MPRKNTHKGRTRQARRYPDGTIAGRSAPRQPIEKIIVPDGKCYFRSRHGKLSFTQEKAEAALKRAQENRARQHNGHVESRIYECPEGGCGKWHLTSRSEYTERSA